MHVYMTALKPCRFRPGHRGGTPLVLYDIFLLVHMQAASLCEVLLAISGCTDELRRRPTDEDSFSTPVTSLFAWCLSGRVSACA